MTPERHHDDKTLIALAAGEPAAASNDLHLRTCHACAETLESLRAVPAMMTDEAVWSAPLASDEPRKETVTFLRKKQAEIWLKQLLAKPREEWSKIVDAHPSWKTEEMVGAMLGESDRLTYVMPPQATELARLAVDMAALLPPGSRFDSLRVYAYALYYTGSFPDGLQAAQAAASLAATDLEKGRIQLQIALIVSEMGDRIAGRDLARGAAAIFERLNDNIRFVAAKRTEGMALYYLRQHRAALEVYSSVLDRCEDAVDLAGLLQNMALCYRELQDFGTATSLFLRALESFQRLGLAAPIAKTRWHLGRIFLAQGNYDDALKTLLSVRDDFREMTMLQDVALVTIDIAQVLSVRNEPEKVVELCKSAAQVFANIGLSESEAALTALALIRDAAASGSLTNTVLIRARREIEKRPVLQLSADNGVADVRASPKLSPPSR